MNSDVRVVGMVWYRSEDYDAIRRIMADGNIFSTSFLIWRMEAETGEKKLRRNGHTVVRVFIDPETFPDWCRTRGLNIDAKARTTFADGVAYETVRSSHGETGGVR